MSSNPLLILDAEGRIVAVLLGRPEGDDWDEVIVEMASVMERVRRAGVKRGVLKANHLHHRRGDYFGMDDGVTKGPGQKKPGNRAHSKEYRRLLQILKSHRSIRRVIGFQSSGFARYFPKLYKDYRDAMRGVYEHQPELEQPFLNSVFPAATWNLGPDVVTREHEDRLNAPHGICPVTSAGNYDYTRGGHLYLKQFKLVLEFPSGSTDLIPSAAVTHGNTPIAPGETRYSMTQYAAAELFRWSAYGHRSAKSLVATKEGREKKRQFDGEPGARAATALGLWSKADELVADREAVFGRG
ncbi:hypothetical protein C8R47DRAFT_967470 [Mycena vitilis]|nr:hypothetical protein C8R47DRAFT_967470 [Mycena vitilis]